MTSRLLLPLVGILCLASPSRSLDNGLARTPPMGWLSWERFLCNIDCATDPENCISERLYKTMADIMATQGYLDAGYQFVNIDDCWMSNRRDVDGRLQPNATRFPDGIKALADYIHSKGLKFGIYQDSGLKTCAGYPGSLCHYMTDARTFADWGVDMLKLDGCNVNPRLMDVLYPAYTKALNKTGRKIVFSCSWPAYQVDLGMKPNYHAIGRACNMWRNYDDITDSWDSVLSILDYYATVQNTLVGASGPGRWSDPDMLIIGNYGLSYDQSKTQMALWAILAAPLFMSVDLRTIRPEFKDILLNKQIIAINQDPLGRMGRRITTEKGIEIWARPVTPLADDGSTSAAIVLFNRRHIGGPVKVTIQLASIGLNYFNGYKVTDLYDPSSPAALFKPLEDITVAVNPSGVVMLKAEPVPAPRQQEPQQRPQQQQPQQQQPQQQQPQQQQPQQQPSAQGAAEEKIGEIIATKTGGGGGGQKGGIVTGATGGGGGGAQGGSGGESIRIGTTTTGGFGAGTGATSGGSGGGTGGFGGDTTSAAGGGSTGDFGGTSTSATGGGGSGGFGGTSTSSWGGGSAGGFGGTSTSTTGGGGSGGFGGTSTSATGGGGSGGFGGTSTSSGGGGSTGGFGGTSTSTTGGGGSGGFGGTGTSATGGGSTGSSTGGSILEAIGLKGSDGTKTDAKS